MNRWAKKVAVVTGSASGIGAACLKDLVNSGLKVVALDLNEKRLKDYISTFPDEKQKCITPIKCDVSNECDVKSAFDWIEQNLGGVDALINNAGTARSTELVAVDNSQHMKDVIGTNIFGVINCTREAFKSMKQRNFDGHVIVLNSIAGHRVPNFGPLYPSFNIYPATKFVITAMVETYRQEFMNNGTKIKITSISPGATATNVFTDNMGDLVKTFPMLKPEDVSNAIMFALSTPPHVQIHELTIKPVGEPA